MNRIPPFLRVGSPHLLRDQRPGRHRRITDPDRLAEDRRLRLGALRLVIGMHNREHRTGLHAFANLDQFAEAHRVIHRILRPHSPRAEAQRRAAK